MLFAFALLFLFSSSVYSLLLCLLIKYWIQLPEPKTQLFDYPAVSILIPARNESKNILACLESVYRQDYPEHLLELIIIDDHSTDNTIEVIKSAFPQPKILINTTNHIGKKQSLLNGVIHASHEIIISLDADCIAVSDNWLKTMISNLVLKRKRAITAPVIYSSDGSIWQNMEATENLSLMFITGAAYSAGWFNMANGANLAFYKKDFLELNPYSDNSNLASGDDMFLFEKMELVHPGLTAFVKNQEAVVMTNPVGSFYAYLSQRIRWGTKNRYLKSLRLKMLLGFIFFQNSLMILAIASLIFTCPCIMITLGTGILIKCITDYILLRRSAIFFNQRKVLQTYWLSALLYPVMLCITGFLSLFSKSYYWKERKME
ncbi:MAG TPA: glycosyltransferase [Saprospiraceae bacterium]|nr:glycosyltransferase [Saprospiraceae bacterium]